LSVLHEGKRRTDSDSGQTNSTKTVSDFLRHRSGTGKSYCRTKFDVGSERVKWSVPASWVYIKTLSFCDLQFYMRMKLEINERRLWEWQEFSGYTK
jgi:hypothetical protein